MNYYRFDYIPTTNGGRKHKPSNFIRSFKKMDTDALLKATNIFAELIKEHHKIITESFIVPVPGSIVPYNAVTCITPDLAIRLNANAGTHLLRKKYPTQSYCRTGIRYPNELLKSLEIKQCTKKDIILIDDVSTTGTTFLALKYSFIMKGASNVTCFSLAKTLKLF